MKLFNLSLFIPVCLAVTAPFNAGPFDDALSKRQSSPYVAKRDANDTSGLQVDLGYSIYEGVLNSTTGLNTWKGIRYAAPPIGQLRWQAPQVPVTNRTSVIQATAIPNQCPQSNPNQGDQAAAVAHINTAGGSEDCLFLNIYSPQNAQNLPVLVWIHGGGYGFGNGDQDLSAIINANDNGFIGVSIQYRLGAFGFLSSDEVNRFGIPNAGLRDQMFALQWVQSYIGLFGGNSSQVTISGESAGAGSVMIHTMAYGGTLGTSLFNNAIAASPYLPTQYNYNDWVPSQSYYAFALSAGCFEGYAAQSPATSSIFQCLVEKDTETLMNASAAVSSSGKLVTWGFLPVTDGTLIKDLPSVQLQQKQVNGLRMLSGNNANEGALFVTPNITTENDLVDFIQDTFPLFTSDNISKTLLQYPSSNTTDDPNALKYATLGNTGPTAINQSSFATGQQQRANNIYAESTFVCPSYWLADAFNSDGHEAYKYQYSVPPSIHMEDVTAYFGPAASNQGADFLKAFMTIWGNFIIHNNPSISAAIAAGNSTSDEGDGKITNWPTYNNTTPIQINLNQTGGQEADVTTIAGAVVKAYIGPGLTNKFDAVDAGTWEGGRGARCDFWRSIGIAVPE